MAGEVFYILYSYVFGLYVVSLTSMMAEHNHGYHQKDSFYFITFKSIYIKSVRSGPKSKDIISHNWCDVIGLYFASSCMWKFPTYFEDGRMLEYVGINSKKDSLDKVGSKIYSNTIYYFKFQTWNQAFKPA